jgi:hypothetical protein
VPGSAISPSQRGDVDVDAHQIARAFLDVSRRANVALDRGVLGAKASAASARRPKLGPCGVTHSVTLGLFHGGAVESSAVPEVM